MNAHALLSSQGWRGTGHSLHKTDDTIGLAKPLLLNRKDNTFGLGQKQHFTSDQWWMNAFDEQLKGLDTSKDGTVVQTVTTGKLNAVEKGMGKWSVYATFVRGGFLEGTLDLLVKQESTSTESESDETDEEIVKTMIAPVEDDEEDSDEEKEVKKETKEERRARKEAKRQRKEERAARRERKKRKSKKSSTESSDADDEKRKRRAKKEKKRKERAKEAKK